MGDWSLWEYLFFEYFLVILGLFFLSLPLKDFYSYLSLFILYSQLFARLTASPYIYLFILLISSSVMLASFMNFYCQLRLYAAWLSAFSLKELIFLSIFLHFFNMFLFSTSKVYAFTFQSPLISSNYRTLFSRIFRLYFSFSFLFYRI